jgi:hypothetical protein
MSERSAIIARRIAERIIQNTKKRWAGLHEDAVSFAEKEIIQMSQEIHFTGDPNAGPMSPEATQTRGRSFAEATGKNQNADAQVGSQVGPIVIKQIEDKR